MDYEKKELEFLIRGRLYQTPLLTLKQIIKDQKLRKGDDSSLKWMEAIVIITSWLNGVMKDDEEGARALSLLDQMLPCFVIKKEPMTGETPEAIVDNTSKATTSTTEDTLQKMHSSKPSEAETTILSSIRRDFKIVGQVTKDRSISFVSLIRQVEAGEKKGFKEFELVEGIIKAIDPSIPLRGYLEGKTDLTLKQLRGILRAHFCEKTAAALYQELGSAAQGSLGAQDFLLMLLDLKQKILFTSKEQTCEISYTEEQVNTLFKRTLYTGLAEDAIRREIQPVVERPNIQDEDILLKMSEIMLKEEERRRKLNGSSCKSKPCSVRNVAAEEDSSTKKTNNPKEGIVLTALRDLQAEVAALKTTLSSRGNDSASGTDQSSRPRSTVPMRRCTACTAHEARCTHCWRCGSEEHFARGCRAKQSGNAQGSSRRGQE